MEQPLNDRPRWWAMSAVYNRSLRARTELEALGAEVFIPMRYVLRTAAGRKQRLLTPAVHNLLFVRATATGIRAAKARLPYLQYLVRRTDGHASPVVVPDDCMADFIAVASTCADDLIYLSPEEIRLTQGERVRIHGGPFDGASGIFCRIAGKRDRRFVVRLDGIMGVAVTVRPEFLERI